MLREKEIKKVFTFATKEYETYGHGDCGEEYRISPIDPYHTNSTKFHPVFKSKENAIEYIRNYVFNKNKKYSLDKDGNRDEAAIDIFNHFKIVEIELIE